LAAGTQQLAQQMPTLQAGVGQLTQGSQRLSQGAGQLSQGLATLNGQVPQLVSGVAQLFSGSSQVTAGTSQVANGLYKLNNQVPSLTTGVSRLATGGNQLATGVQTLNQKTGALTNGVEQLTTGATKLAAANGKLTGGTDKLQTGQTQLATALQQGADQLKATPLTAKTAKMFAEPSALSHENYSYVPNFGHSIAPFVISLGGFVGVTLLLALFDYLDWLRTPKQLFSLAGLVAGQALLTSGLLLATFLDATHPVSFMLVATLFSLSILVIELALKLYLGRLAVALVGLLLFVQVCVSNNLFPVQTVKTAYAGIATYLPMTYSNTGLAETLTGVGLTSTTVSQGLSAVAMIMLIGGGLIVMKFRQLATVSREAD